jgi:hypothetical protein
MITLCFPQHLNNGAVCGQNPNVGENHHGWRRGVMNFVTAYAENSCQHKDPAMLWLGFGLRVLCKELAPPYPKDRVSISFLVN